jgi:hypothetical protein
MGDKSPKSTHKQAVQKKAKADTDKQKKQDLEIAQQAAHANKREQGKTR